VTAHSLAHPNVVSHGRPPLCKIPKVVHQNSYDSSDLLHQPLLALYLLLSTNQVFNQPFFIFPLGSLVTMPAVQKPKSYKQPKPRTTDDTSEAGPSRPKPRPIEQRDASGIPGVSKLKGQIRQTTRLLAKASQVFPPLLWREEQRWELD
jgi:hypothetical protein